MDIIVTPKGQSQWVLVDLLGRSMGIVELAAPDEYRIIPGERVADSMRSMKHGPFATLDAALSQIEVFTRSTCRLAPAED
jgi:hypothetical protein